MHEAQRKRPHLRDVASAKCFRCHAGDRGIAAKAAGAGGGCTQLRLLAAVDLLFDHPLLTLHHPVLFPVANFFLGLGGRDRVNADIDRWTDRSLDTTCQRHRQASE
ncbi:hypothetical protein GGR00_000054 [Aminobacter aganoensis]|uniref:Uncharacterized protein n=1 Tax=Aminobacter aganoensis TaxID=83264 RepID=A0A7X0CBW9_9HYPH|nr:hypothetical protein [Aminobacter aganoensis]